MQATRDGVVTRYVYDASGNLLAETDAAGTVQRYYLHGQGLLAMATPAGASYCYHFNPTGSTVAMTDQSQAVVNKYAYDPFGANIRQEVQFEQPFKYVGQYGIMTESNGFYYMRARYYDPQVGRFISEDPLGFGGGDLNLYAYVGNGPVVGVDPSGLEPFAIDQNGFSTGKANSTLRCHVNTHDDPAENLIGAAILGVGLIGPSAVSLATNVSTRIMVAAGSPLAQRILSSDFIEAQLPGPWPQSPNGVIGGVVNYLANNLDHRKWDRYENYGERSGK